MTQTTNGDKIPFIAEQAPQAGTGPNAFTPEHKPSRALWAAVGFALIWILPLLIQSVFGLRTSFCADALYFSSLGVVATGLYFICLPGVKRKLAGGGLALAGAVLLAFSAAVSKNVQVYAFHADLGRLLSLRNAYLFIALKNALIGVVLAAAAALLALYLARNRPANARYAAAGGAAAGAYFLSSMVSMLFSYRMLLGNFKARDYASILSELILDALCLFLVFLAIGSLCSTKHMRVRLKGIGLVWAWLALCAMSVAWIASIAMGDQIAGRGSYTTQYVLLAAGVAGYAMLLLKRKAGLYVILLGAGLLLAAQTLSLLEGTIYGADGYGALLASSLLGGVNPLFAFLAVRAGADLTEPAARIPESKTTESKIAKQEETNMPLNDLFSKKSTASAGTYKEADNVGTRQETMSQATAYWLYERPGLSKRPPFTLFIMPSAESAKAALLELPFIHEAADSKKLICDRIMTFGFYAVTYEGASAGACEALVSGMDLTLDEFNKAEAAFAAHGGTRKNSDAPSPSVKVPSGNGDAKSVRYQEKITKNGATYEVYTAPDKGSAILFLKGKQVTQGQYYICVDTPEGSFGRDINGIYQE